MVMNPGDEVGVPLETDVAGISQAHPRILIIDDDLLVAETFLFALTQSGFVVRLVVPATEKQLERGLDWGPDVALLDVDLVAVDPVTLVERIGRSGVPVAVMGNESKQETLLRCAQGGAGLVVPPNLPLEDLIRMLSKFVEAVEIRTPEVVTLQDQGRSAQTLTGRVRHDIFAILTPSEQKVLVQLMAGRTDDEIAKGEWVALSTVRSQIRTVLQKLGVNSPLAAVAFARQAGWTGGGALSRARS
jgi:two-component system, NarL family, nitrate/nitrite response regulator NarL